MRSMYTHTDIYIVVKNKPPRMPKIWDLSCQLVFLYFYQFYIYIYVPKCIVYMFRAMTL